MVIANALECVSVFDCAIEVDILFIFDNLLRAMSGREMPFAYSD